MRKDELMNKVRVPEAHREALNRIYDLWQVAHKTGRSVSSMFYDPGTMVSIEKALVLLHDVPWSFEGGAEDAEYRSVLLWPSYGTDENHPLRVVSLRSAAKSSSWSHRDVLGSLLGLGVQRERFGDIHIQPWGAQVVCKEDFAQIIESQLLRVGRDSVSVSIEPLTSLMPADSDYEQVTVFLPSLRLDAFVAAVWHLSRGDAQSLVQGERVKVNYQVVSSTSASLKEGDKISVRGYGRAVFESLSGTTKKDRLRVSILKTRT